MASWTELWSVGDGGSRMYCGIARTEEGFAVDVFRGDSCVASQVHGSRSEAERAARAIARRYMRSRLDAPIPVAESTAAGSCAER